MGNKLVSIIIRTKNEERWLSACLRNVFKQTYKNFEVIIVDNQSTDHTLEKAKKFPVKIITIDKYFPGKAINKGIQASKGEYLVCLSGHCVPVSDLWLKNLIADLDQENIAGIYGRQEPLAFTSDLDKRDLISLFGLDKKKQIKDSFFHNANSAFRRDIWGKYPFNEEVTNIEDRVWGEEVIKNGLNIIYEPEASVYHWHGIHQNMNAQRAKSIVKILESLDNFNSQGKHQTPEDLKILAVIPVKGDMLMLNNQPLIRHTINSAKKSKFISDIVIATDNDEIATFAKKNGVPLVVYRPNTLSEEYIDIFDVVSYAVNSLKDQEKLYDVIVLLEEIYPFRKDGMIDAMINQLVIEGHDTVLAGQSENRSVWMTANDQTKLMGHQDSKPMPSSLKQYKATIGLIGMCCVTHSASLRNNSVFSGSVGIFQINDLFSKIVIRSKQELELAEAIEKTLMKKN
jgi:rhamnosyltransferase